MRVALVNPPDVSGHVSDRDKAGGLGTMLPVRGRHGPVLPPLDLLYSAASQTASAFRKNVVNIGRCARMGLEVYARKLAAAAAARLAFEWDARRAALRNGGSGPGPGPSPQGDSERRAS